MSGPAPWFAALRRWWWRSPLRRAWRFPRIRANRWLDDRFESRHLAEYGWSMKLGCGPFSRGESTWHACEGHVWERIDWPYGRAGRRGHRSDRVTRCLRCGAPRCDSYTRLDAMQLFEVVRKMDNVAAPTDEDDRVSQYRRCTLERHHSEAHDYLTGDRIEVGA